MLLNSYFKVILTLVIGISVVAVAQEPVPGPKPATNEIIQSGPFEGMIPVTLHEGSNALYLEGDSTPDLIFRAWRDNGNAHGFNLTTFYRHAHYPADRFSSSTDRWELVPFFDDSAPQAEKMEMDSYRDWMGADCVLADLFLLGPAPGSGKPAMAVMATREFGETFISSMPVSFDFYVLKKGDGVGRPSVFFDKRETVKSKGKYCDVADAMNKEFGVGPKFEGR